MESIESESLMTNIPTFYLNKVETLAQNFATNVSSKYQREYATKSFKSTYNNYVSLAIFLYVYNQKISPEKTKWNFNRIASKVFQYFSKKYYSSILKDLEEHKIFKINHNYLSVLFARKMNINNKKRIS